MFDCTCNPVAEHYRGHVTCYPVYKITRVARLTPRVARLLSRCGRRDKNWELECQCGCHENEVSRDLRIVVLLHRWCRVLFNELFGWYIV